MTVELVTVEGIPIVGVGTYPLSSGETTFSAEHLADAVLASQDPTVPAPRIKLGHNDARFDAAIASNELDGEPAFGTVQNLRLSDNGQEIIGDLVDVPSWLAETIASSYPGRSIEGAFGFDAPSGRHYSLVIAQLALLGVTWPGITSLDDLREVLEANGPALPEPVAAASGEAVSVLDGSASRYVSARISRPGSAEPTPSPDWPDAVAGLDLGAIRQAFSADCDEGEVPMPPEGTDVGPQRWWWPRSVRVEDDGTLCLIVDDDEGHLLQIPFTVAQDDVVYGEARAVVETYIPVKAPAATSASSQPARVLASWGMRAASRPSTTTEVETMDVDPAVLRTRLGLPEDADEAAITAALAAEADPVVKPVATPETPAAPEVPEGMVLVDQETFAQVREGAEQGLAVAARLGLQDRDAIIAAAIDAGKFPTSRRGHYETLWERDEEGTRTLLTASVDEGGLAEGLIPVGNREVGRAGNGEGDPSSADAEHEAYMARHFPQAAARLRGDQPGRPRIRQEA